MNEFWIYYISIWHTFISQRRQPFYTMKNPLNISKGTPVYCRSRNCQIMGITGVRQIVRSWELLECDKLNVLIYIQCEKQ